MEMSGLSVFEFISNSFTYTYLTKAPKVSATLAQQHDVISVN